MPMSGMAKHNISSTNEFDQARKAPAGLANQIDFLTEEIDSVSKLQAEVESVTERLKAILDGTSERWAGEGAIINSLAVLNCANCRKEDPNPSALVQRGQGIDGPRKQIGRTTVGTHRPES